MVVGHVGSAGGHRFFRQTELTIFTAEAPRRKSRGDRWSPSFMSLKRTRIGFALRPRYQMIGV
jgi:hypothetical protein